MGRQKLEIKFVENGAKRRTHCKKRLNGLFKKIHELSVLTGEPFKVAAKDEAGKYYYHSRTESGFSHIDPTLSNLTDNLMVYDGERNEFVKRIHEKVRPTLLKGECSSGKNLNECRTEIPRLQNNENKVLDPQLQLNEGNIVAAINVLEIQNDSNIPALCSKGKSPVVNVTQSLLQDFQSLDEQRNLHVPQLESLDEQREILNVSTDGVVSMAEFENWIEMFMMTSEGDLLPTAPQMHHEFEDQLWDF